MFLERTSVTDVSFLGVVAVGMPLMAYLFHLQDKRALARGESFDRPRAYLQTAAFLWAPTIALSGYWLYVSRTFATFGFNLQVNTGMLLAWAFVGIASFALVAQMWAAHTKKDFARKIVDQYLGLGDTVRWLPKTRREFAMFCGLSVTAGITEEVLFRAFLIWGFSHWMPVWVAAMLALFAFLLGHLYQEKPSLILRVGFAGTVFTLVYLWSGSIWPAIVLHAVIDIASGGAYFLAQQTLSRAPSDADGALETQH